MNHRVWINGAAGGRSVKPPRGPASEKRTMLKGECLGRNDLVSIIERETHQA